MKHGLSLIPILLLGAHVLAAEPAKAPTPATAAPEPTFSAPKGTATPGTALQSKMQQENRQYTTVSNVLKTKHDTAKNAIGNIR